MIIYKKPHEIEKIRAAGKVVAGTLRRCFESILPGKTTPLDLDGLASRLIREAGGYPSFLNYRGYPAATCISVNNVVIHGIPNDCVLEEGDIVDLDFGVTLDNWVADGAWTYPVGTVTPQVQRLLSITKESLYQGIAKARIGNTLGDVGSTIEKYVKGHGYSVVKEMVGHGVGTAVHEEPNVPNYGKPGKGVRIKEGMTICIEPMINQGTEKIVILEDQWTVMTADGKLSAHFEHTVAVTRDGPDILTLE